MDKQNPSEEKRVYTAEEIARLEAEAAAAISRGEAPSRGEVPPRPETRADAPQPQTPPDFVPYVDDVVDAPAPKRPAPKAPAPEPESPAPTAEAEIEDGDDEDYIPSNWEVRVNALTPKQWMWVQIAGGALLGLVALALLLIGGEELSTYRLIVAALVALLVPRYIERVIRRDLVVARRAMIVALLVGIAVAFLVLGAQHGFQFRKVE